MGIGMPPWRLTIIERIRGGSILSTCWVVVLGAPDFASGPADGLHFRPTGYNVSTNSMVHLAVDPAAANGVGLTRQVACEQRQNTSHENGRLVHGRRTLTSRNDHPVPGRGKHRLCGRSDIRRRRQSVLRQLPRIGDAGPDDARTARSRCGCTRADGSTGSSTTAMAT